MASSSAPAEQKIMLTSSDGIDLEYRKWLHAFPLNFIMLTYT
jgi:hypothetical protein